jgi:hypothetical protein
VCVRPQRAHPRVRPYNNPVRGVGEGVRATYEKPLAPSPTYSLPLSAKKFAARAWPWLVRKDSG